MKCFQKIFEENYGIEGSFSSLMHYVSLWNIIASLSPPKDVCFINSHYLIYVWHKCHFSLFFHMGHI